MHYIIHRCNTLLELGAVPGENGVEIDLRSHGQRLILAHDPFTEGIDFEAWIEHFHHSTLVLNIKEEGIEERVTAIVEKKGITDYFLLDVSFPVLVRMVNSGNKHLAVRFSEFESLETVLYFAGKAEWVWVDCFEKMPLTLPIYKVLSGHFKICIASPELQNHDPELIRLWKSQLSQFPVDAVCTKYPRLWQG